MRSIFVVAVLLTSVSIPGPAYAQNYPWCAQYSGRGGTNCGFSTWAQCRATVSGIGGYCARNTLYVPTASGAPRRAKRVKRQHG